MSDLELTSFIGRQRRLVNEAWAAFLTAHPRDASIRLTPEPKPDYGTRLTAGESWHAEDKNRTRRVRTPLRRLTSQTSMVDGSPIRQLTRDVDAFDVDGDLWFGEAEQPVERDDFEIVPDEGDQADTATELSPAERARWFDGVHCGDVDPYSFDNKPYLLEYCEVCTWEPLPLKWPEPQCEFPDSPMPDGQYCHCNGCVTQPERNPGEQPRYCSPKCARRMDDALDRADRRRAGKRSRRPAGNSWAPFLDFFAEYRREMRDRARGTHPVEMPPYAWYKTDLPKLEPVSRPERPRYCPPIRIVVKRPSKLRAAQYVELSDFNAVARAGRMRVESWPAEDLAMYCGGKWTQVTEVTTPEHPLTVGQTA